MTTPTLVLRWLSACAWCIASAFAHAQEGTADIQRLVRAGQYEQALQRLDAALATRPKDAELRFLRGVVLAEQKKSAEAIVAFVRLTEDYPELAEPWNNLAVLYAGNGEYEKARAALDLAIKTRPDYATAHENLGDVYVRLAARAYDKAQSIDTTNANAKRKLALSRDLLASTAPLAAPPSAASPASGSAPRKP